MIPISRHEKYKMAYTWSRLYPLIVGIVHTHLNYHCCVIRRALVGPRPYGVRNTWWSQAKKILKRIFQEILSSSLFWSGQSMTEDRGTIYIKNAVCSILPSSTCLVQTCRKPLPPSPHVAQLHSCMPIGGMHELCGVNCPYSVVCCHCLLHCSGTKAPSVVIAITIPTSWLLLLFEF